MWSDKKKKQVAMEKNIKYISASSLGQYEKQPNTFFAQRLIKDALEREEAGLAAHVGTAFDIEVKKKLLDLGVPISEGITLEDILRSRGDCEHTKQAKVQGLDILKQYHRAKIMTNGNSLPLARDWKQVEGKYYFTIDGVPILALLDAVVRDPSTKQLVPFDWKVIGGAAKTGVSPKKGFAGVCISGAWGKPHKLYTEWEAKSPNSGYEGVNIPMELIDDKFATQFCIYGWALQDNPGRINFRPFPVHFDSAVYNGKDRTIKIYTYRAICSVEWQEKVLDRLQVMWRDLSTGGHSLIRRLTSKNNITVIKGAAKDESWF